MSFPRYERYKESGVEWLGEVPEGWEVTKIRRLCEIKKRIVGEIGFNVLSITQQGLKIKDIESNDGQLSMDYSKYQLVEIGDFAMNHMDLLTGYVDISDGLGVTSPDYRVFTIKDKKVCYDRYILYLFQMGYKIRIFYAFGQGSSQLGRWRLPTEQFNELTFPIPPLPEQQTIAAFLDRETGKIDELMTEQERLIALLKEKRQAVISHAVTKGLNPDAPMKDSRIEWLGEVPDGWEVNTLRRNLSKHLSNGIFKKKDDFGQGTLLINVFDIYRDDFRVDYNTLDRITCTSEEQSNYNVEAGDLFFVRSSLKQEGIAVVAVAENLNESVVFECHLIQARFNAKLFLGRFGSYLFNSAQYRAQMIRSAKVTTMTTIDQEAILSLPIVIPPIDEQSAIVAFLDSEIAIIDTLVGEARHAISLLKERRSALISAAVTGKIDARGAV